MGWAWFLIILGASILLAQFYWWIWIIVVFLILFGLGYLFYSIYSIKKSSDNIGHEAHLGGAIAGFFSTIFISPTVIITNFFTILILLIPIVYFYIKSNSFDKK